MSLSAVDKPKIRLSIFASGSGSNAEAIMSHFSDHTEIEVAQVITNKADAGVIERATRHQISSVVFKNSDFKDGVSVLNCLQQEKIDFIILAGFLRMIPEILIECFPDKILNIHPALLPEFGGKGMYGMNVHKAVKAAQKTQSGPTIHLVNKEYDKGRHLFQAAISLDPTDEAESIASKVLELEHKYYPKVIERYVLGCESE